MAKTLLRLSVIAALLPTSAGVAAAEPLPIADVKRSEGTGDGWSLSAALTGMTINSVPNMAATPFTREGFVTGKAIATIDGDGEVAINSGVLVVGVQLGCQVNLSQGANLSGGLEIGSVVGLDNSLTALGADPFANIGGEISVNLLPGTIANVGLGTKALKGRTGEISIHDAHVKVDACGGQVAVRFFTSAKISTDRSDDSVNTYGEILQL